MYLYLKGLKLTSWAKAIKHLTNTKNTATDCGAMCIHLSRFYKINLGEEFNITLKPDTHSYSPKTFPFITEKEGEGKT